MSEHTDALLERIALAVEKLGEDPVIHMETGPPVCPHCERVNPVVRVEESGGSGYMAEFVIQAQCQHCNQVFYAIPLQWDVAADVSQVAQMVEQRKEISGYGDNGNQEHSGEDQGAEA